jgi:outer membrane protein assembly factor BamD (BamD/ComL family)
MAARWSRLPVLLLATPGCALRDYLWEPPNRPATADAMAVRPALAASPSELSPELAAAHEKFKAGDVSGAESAYHKIADNTKNPPPVAEEARFYEAECLYQQNHWPKACDTYHKMMLDFPSGTYRARGCRRMFDIANYWLDDVRAERQAKKDKGWMAITPVVHFEKTKPFLDLEGRALQALEQVHLNDIGGPLADKALFLAGGIKFYRQDYKEADYYYTLIVEQHPNSSLAPQAVELAIISKHLSTGGPDYDGRKVAEARRLIETAAKAYPDLATQRPGFLERQLQSINYQQAEKDFNTAEFYRRTNHPGAAFYYYEIVRRSYPGTKFAEDAAHKMAEVRAEVESGKYSPDEADVFRSLQKQIEGMLGSNPKPKTADGEAPPAEAPRQLPATLLPR